MGPFLMKAVGKIYSDDSRTEDAIPTLEKLAEHEDKQIAARAKAALRQVRGR